MNERDLELTLAVLEVLNELGGILISEDNLYRSARLKTMPRGERGEIGARILWLSEKQLIISTRNDLGLMFKITDAGKLWLQEHG